MRSFFLVCSLAAFSSLAQGQSANGEVYCPTGASYNAQYRLCVENGEAIGPFSAEMIRQCGEKGGGKACETRNRWAFSMASRIRGTERCQPGTELIEAANVCLSGNEVYGPFTPHQYEQCKKAGGKEACDLMRWHKNTVLSGLLEASNETAPIPAPVSAPVLSNSDLDYPEGWGWGAFKWQRKWSVNIADSLDDARSAVLVDRSQVMNDDYVLDLCPNYNDLEKSERKVFWAHLFASMAEHESSFKPQAMLPNDGGGNTSIGLLQLSYEDQKWAGEWGCDVDANDPYSLLVTPEVNLNCAVAIMARQVTLRKRVFLDYGEHLYWAVIAPSFMKKRASDNVLATFKAHQGEKLGFCNAN